MVEPPPGIRRSRPTTRPSSSRRRRRSSTTADPRPRPTSRRSRGAAAAEAAADLAVAARAAARRPRRARRVLVLHAGGRERRSRPVVGQAPAGRRGGDPRGGLRAGVARQESAKPSGVVVEPEPGGRARSSRRARPVRSSSRAGPAKETVPDVIGEQPGRSGRRTSRRQASTRRSSRSSPTSLTASWSRQNPPRGRREGGLGRRADGVEGRQAGRRARRRRDDVVRGDEDAAGGGLRGQSRRRAVRPGRAGPSSRRTRSPGATAKQGTSVRLNVAQAPGGDDDRDDHDRPRRRHRPRRPRRRRATVPDVVGSELADGAREFARRGAEGRRALRPVGRAAGQDRRAGPAGRDAAQARLDRAA